MPGIGFRLGAEFLAVVGDPALIGSADQLAAWAGLAPVARDWGKRTGRLHRSKNVRTRASGSVTPSIACPNRFRPATSNSVRYAITSASLDPNEL